MPSAPRSSGFVFCADYEKSPEEATLSETSFKINCCSSSCKYTIRLDSRIIKTKQTIKADVKSIAIQYTAFPVPLFIFSASLVLSKNYSGQFTD